jgi:hypothetical protein
MTDTSELCDACTCTDEATGYAADCRGRDLATALQLCGGPAPTRVEGQPMNL